MTSVLLLKVDMIKLVPENSILRLPQSLWINTFDPNECQLIIDYCSKLKEEKAETYNQINRDPSTIRKSEISWVNKTEETTWIYDRCIDVIGRMNQIYGYDLDVLETLQFTKYTDGGFYTRHTDNSSNVVGGNIRKLSFSIELSDPLTFKGGDLLLYYQDTPDVIQKAQGRANFFASNTLHEVTPVTEGTRYALVGWLLGPPWR